MAGTGICNSLEDLLVSLLADCCLDEVWLKWLKENDDAEKWEKWEQWVKNPADAKDCRENVKEALNAPEEVRAIAIACAATELGKKIKENKDKAPYYGYAADFGNIPRGMYKRLFGGDCKGTSCPKDTPCGTYSKDTMTNFFYVMKIAIALLSPERFAELSNPQNEKFLPENISPSNNFATSGKSELRERNCFSKYVCSEKKYDGVYDAYKEALQDARKELGDVVDSVEKQLNIFGKRCSQLGNYACIPEKLGKEADLNRRKGTGDMLKILGEGLEVWVNDQFALFAHWVDDNMVDEEIDKIEKWKKAMLLDGVWETYLDAAKAYKEIWRVDPGSEKDADELREHRLKAFTKYLNHVNNAIEARSQAIAKKLIFNNQEASNE